VRPQNKSNGKKMWMQTKRTMQEKAAALTGQCGFFVCHQNKSRVRHGQNEKNWQGGQAMWCQKRQAWVLCAPKTRPQALRKSGCEEKIGVPTQEEQFWPLSQRVKTHSSKG
jgi:hypothetical protein